MISRLWEELQAEPTDWDSIYFTFQSAGLSDPRWHCNRFDSQPISVIIKQLDNINTRNENLANYHSLSVARLGLVMSSSDKLTLDDFLPFPESLGTKEVSSKMKIGVATAKIFMQGVRDKTIPSKVVGAFTPYLDQILELSES